jgi:hypothetical protein
VEVNRPGDCYISDVELWLVVFGHNKLVERQGSTAIKVRSNSSLVLELELEFVAV